MGFPHPARPSLFHPTQPHLPAFLLNTTHRLPVCSPAPNTCSQQQAWTQPGLSRASPSCRIKLVILQTHLMKGHQTAPCHPKDTKVPRATSRSPDCPVSPQGLLSLSPKGGSVAGRVTEEQAAPQGWPSRALSASRSNPPGGNAIPWEHSRL